MEGSSTLGTGKSALNAVAENICTVVRNDAVNDPYRHLVSDAPAAA